MADPHHPPLLGDVFTSRFGNRGMNDDKVYKLIRSHLRTFLKHVLALQDEFGMPKKVGIFVNG